MGKPFRKELERVTDTIKWAVEQNTESLTSFLFESSKRPLFIVGSGGSLSACYYGAYLYQKHGSISKAITPLELYYSKEAFRDSNVLFISSSGKNTDILFGFNIAIQQEPNSITTFCMKENSPLSKLAAMYESSQPIDFAIPSKKDGFLATNSLVAYFVLLAKAFGYLTTSVPDFSVSAKYLKELEFFVGGLSPMHSLTILYGGLGQSVAYDIESKFTEAALGNVLLSDFRNFGHGRHHWFAKRGKHSAIVALVTPEEEKIAEKTLGLLPSSIPILIIRSEINSPIASIELLIKSFYLANAFGEVQNIDPGRPGVPSFGSKLYHLRYSSFYKISGSSKIPEKVSAAILRKTKTQTITNLSENEIDFWIEKYENFCTKLNSTKFHSLILDYDGTICSSKNRLTGPNQEISTELNRYLEKGFVLGIATGRGQSVRKDLQKVIKKEFWKSVLIGYYNGSDIGFLSDESYPKKENSSSKSLNDLKKIIDALKIPFTEVTTELRPFQITILVDDTRKWNNAKLQIQNAIMAVSHSEELQLLESSHSMDLVVKEKASKNNVIEECIKLIRSKEKVNVLCIGDKGQWPGNDFELLSHQFALSVNEVSGDPESCWNLAEVGQRDTAAALHYLRRIKLNKTYFNLDL